MKIWILALVLMGSVACNGQEKQSTMAQQPPFPIQKTEAQWKAELGEERYRILRQAGTERPFSGTYNMHFQKGVYSCGGCGAPLFESSSKFDGHCGWPSFDREIEEGKILERKDLSHGMVRTEILCAQCGGHLGHVFDDGPTETGLRYCVNSLSINFEEKK
jgi:peptide-methionine (R)-S-oxide reductase